LKNKKGPLDNLLVVDLTRVLAGPYATMILSDLGARIIKVEPPNGDDSRSFGPFIENISTYFSSLNRDKESICLNLKKNNEKQIFLQILSHADILVENYRPGTLSKLGLSPSYLMERFPSLIIASCSGFGQTGPWSKKPAYDVIVQALGGIMSLTGYEKQDPVRVGSSIGDITAGLFTVIGIQSALYKRTLNNKGAHIDISMLDCQIAILENAISRFYSEKKIPKKIGSRHPSICPFEAYKCRDNYIVVAAGNDNLFKNFCKCLNAEHLIKNNNFNNNDNRLKNAEKLKVFVEKILIKKNSSFWIKEFEKSGVPVGKVNNIKEAINLDQIKFRNMIVKIKKNNITKLEVSGNPIKISGYYDSPHRREAPKLNSHRKKILKEFNIKDL
jgi:CoA:oxalate CoA-transferase